MKKEITYSEQIVAYIDILGYKKMIEKANLDDVKALQMINYITRILEFEAERFEGIKSIFGENHYKINYKMFSDCICVSSNFEQGINLDKKMDGTLIFLTRLCIMQANLVEFGIFIRGGVTENKHFQDNNIIFSPALVKAHEMESMNAINPRILIDKDIIKHLHKCKRTELKKRMLKKDADGLFFIDYLSLLLKNDRFFLEKHKKIVENKLKSNVEPKIRSKYLWVANYHNYICNLYNDFNDLRIDNDLTTIKEI